MNTFREASESLVLIALLLVSIVCGMLLERRWAAIESRQTTMEQRQEQLEKQQHKTNEIMFGHI